MVLPQKSEQGLLRLPEVLKLFPVSRTHFLQGVKDGKYPQPVRISQRIVAWHKSDIIRLIENNGTSQNQTTSK